MVLTGRTVWTVYRRFSAGCLLPASREKAPVPTRRRGPMDVSLPAVNALTRLSPSVVFRELGIDKAYVYNASAALTLWPSHLMTPSAVFRELGIYKAYMHSANVVMTLWPSHLVTPGAVFRELGIDKADMH